MWRYRKAAVLLAAIAATGAGAQPTFRSGVQVVEVDVRVFDRQGEFVSGLSADDFELLENGEPQQLDALYYVGGGMRSPRATASAARQTWILFFDIIHMTAGAGFDRARAAAETFVRERLPDGDLAGIVAGDRMINNRITSVKDELLAAIRQVQPRSDARILSIELTREWPRLLDEDEAIRISRNETEALRRAVARACADDPDACKRAEPDLEVRAKGLRLQQEFHRRSLQTLASLNALASGLAKMPGPKTLVLLSDGFIAQDVEGTVRSVVGQAARAGARVYAIDVRGLSRGANPGLIDQGLAQDPYGAVTPFDGLADGPNALAVDTGGLMIRNENNIGRALDRIADDSGRYYLLAYRPSNSTLDGSYRPIQVRVKRDGLRVRARRGYLALEPSRLLRPQPTQSTAAVEAAAPPAPPAAVESAPEPPPAVAPVLSPTVPPRSPLPSPPPAAPVVPAGAIRLRPDVEDRVQALATRDSASPDALATEGWEAYQKGDVESALVAFSQAAAQPGVRPWVLYALGMSQAGLGQAAAAIASWERVRQAAPDFQPVYMDLADAYAGVSDLSSALAIVRQAEARWPDSADVHGAIGVIHVRRGALDAGIAALVKASELTPEDGLAHLNLGRAYALRYQRGRRWVSSQRRWIAPEPDRRRAIEALTRCVQLGGPYATQAKEELTLLEWSRQG